MILEKLFSLFDSKQVQNYVRGAVVTMPPSLFQTKKVSYMYVYKIRDFRNSPAAHFSLAFGNIRAPQFSHVFAEKVFESKKTR